MDLFVGYLDMELLEMTLENFAQKESGKGEIIWRRIEKTKK
jgi:hypothetical protein